MTGLGRTAYALLAPAPFVFAARALASFADEDLPGYAFAVVGILGAIGTVLLLMSEWNGQRIAAFAGAGVAFLGHYVVADYVDANLGAAMVYAGTGTFAWLHFRPGAWPAAVAIAGALLRGPWPPVGNAVLAAGAIGLGLVLVTIAWQGTQDPPTA